MLATLILLIWIPAWLLVYALMPTARLYRALIGTYLVGFFFLPHLSIPIPGLPDFDREAAIMYAMLLGVLVFDMGRILAFRPRWYDLPMLVLCLAPGFSSLSNDLGIWDGLSEVVRAGVSWGIPYLVGRLYLKSPEAFRDLAIGFIIFAMIYVPLSLWEMRMSPQLHLQVYGFSPRKNTARGAFYPFQFKPFVFMGKTFFVAMTFAVATVFTTALSLGRTRRAIWVFPLFLLIPGFFVVTVMTKVWSAILLMVIGLSVLAWTRMTRTRIALICCVLVVPLYIGTRIMGEWSGNTVVEMIRPISEQKAKSFQVRLENEDQLAAKAMERPVFGWGAWGRGRIYSDYDGRNLSRTDGLWVILLNKNGFVGMLAWLVAMYLPLLLFLRTMPPGEWLTRENAIISAMAIVLSMHMIDMIPNAFRNPVFFIGAGGLVSICVAIKSTKRKRAYAARRQMARATYENVPPARPAR